MKHQSWLTGVEQSLRLVSGEVCKSAEEAGVLSSCVHDDRLVGDEVGES